MSAKRFQSAIPWICLCLWICFIWSHSMRPGAVSANQSKFVVELLKPLFYGFGINDSSLMNHLVRKAAHFSEYAILGGLSLWTVHPKWSMPRERLLPFCLIWVLVPCIDEFIQLHVPRRSGNPADVALDMCGFLCAVLVGWLLSNLRRGR